MAQRSHGGDYAIKMFSLALSRHRLTGNIICVNDPYNIPFTIKDGQCQQRRGTRSASYTGGSRNICMKTLDKFAPSKELNSMFCNTSNNLRLQTEFTQLCHVSFQISSFIVY